MNKNDIIRKLTSRKFWLAMAAFITELILLLKATQRRQKPSPA